MTFQKIEEAIATLQAAGRRVSVRNVRDLKGGSHRDISRLLKALSPSSGAAVVTPPLQEKTYLCARWPRYSIRHIKFQDGRYTTCDPKEQALIESCDAWGVHIHAVEPGGADGPPWITQREDPPE